MSVYGWKSFMEDEGQPEKPRIYGVREMIGPNYTFLNRNVLQDILESMGQVVDGLKFTRGSHSLMPKTFIKERGFYGKIPSIRLLHEKVPLSWGTFSCNGYLPEIFP
ncbi:hypothetical protein AAC387_Pa05g1098 [Persea americana]